ncbi:MAG: hypothetical protein C4305_02090 [Thermoleophilia bacterium]
MARLAATEVSRNFSAVLNRVAAGEEIEVIRNGAPIAAIRPARGKLLSAQRFRQLFASAPPVDARLAADLWTIWVEAESAGSSWPSCRRGSLLVDRERGAGSTSPEEALGDEERGISVAEVWADLVARGEMIGAHDWSSPGHPRASTVKPRATSAGRGLGTQPPASAGRTGANGL